MSIYTKNSALSPSQIENLRANADTQNEFILNILKKDPDRGLAIFEMQELTDIHYSSVNRALSSMSSETGSAAKRFKDANGEMPIIKRKDKTSFNPKTGKTCCTYWYNRNYVGV